MDFARRRLLNQGIGQSLFKKPQDVVRWLGAVQAQDFSGAKWALGLRLSGATDTQVEQAFTNGEILRTHLLRPTWHFVTPADIHWLLKLTAGRVHAANAYMYRKLELDKALFIRSETVLFKALRGGQQLTRDELREIFRKSGIRTEGEARMGYLLMHAELEGIICSGARQGKQFTYALLEERVGPACTLASDQALAQLAGQYFKSRGPATVQDFAKWSGLTMRDARKALESIRSGLQSEILDRQIYWFTEPSKEAAGEATKAFLLSIYDEYVSGYKDRSAIVSMNFSKKLIAQGNALNYVLVLNGQIVGSWKREFSTRAIAIETTLFRPLTRNERRALGVAADRYAQFFGLPVTCCYRVGRGSHQA